MADFQSVNEKSQNEKVALDRHNGSGNSSDEEYANPTGINEKALVRRLDLKLLPPLTLLYLLSFLDRSNSMFLSCLRESKMLMIVGSWQCEAGWIDEELALYW
jgi:hypothetical protein